MRILAVQTGLSPHSVLGGTITDRKFLTKLADRGVEIHLLVPKNEPYVDHENFTVHFYRRPFSKVLTRWLKIKHYPIHLDIFFAIRRVLDQIGDVDWIRFNSPYSNGIGTYWAARGRYPIWASYLHREDIPFWNRVDSWLPGKVDLITCLSETTRNDLVDICPASDHKNNIIVPIGIDAKDYSYNESSRHRVRDQLGIGKDDVLILFIGRIIKRKGIQELVAAWKLVEGYSQAKLLIIGQPFWDDMDLYEQVKQLANSEKVHYIEEIPHEEIPQYYSAADIFFFPTQLEGFGMVVGEAMSTNLPIVTTNAKGVREVVDSSCAFMSDVSDYQQMAKHLEKLILDSDLRQAMGNAARKRIIEYFDWDIIITQLIQKLNTSLV